MEQKVRSNRRKEQRKRELRRKAALTAATIVLAAVLLSAFWNHNKKETQTVQAVDHKVKTLSEEESTTEPETEEEETLRYPKVSEQYTEIVSENVRSPYVALLDVENNCIIAGKNKDARIYPASMTKVMTLIVAVEHLQDLSQTFTMTADIVDPLFREGASRAGFEAGDTVNMEDMLYGLILPSGADAAVGLAIMTAGSEDNFAVLTNEKCEELGLQNTHFMNASGLHNENQYTTPVEMAMILAYAMQNPECAKILSIYQHTTAPLASHPEGILLTSTMFGRMYGTEVPNVTIQAGKTGYTQEAGNCLVSYAEKTGHHYIALTAGAENRWHVVYDDFELYGNYLPADESETQETTGTSETTQAQNVE